MKTITERLYLFPEDWVSLDYFIERLSSIRAKTNQPINVGVQGRLSDDDSRIELSWERPMTNDELERYSAYQKKAEESTKELRRQEWKKLNKEFGNEC